MISFSHIDRDFQIVVIGASAGGLHALSVLLEKLPSDYLLPIIVVQHRSKDQRELLEEVLQSKCRLFVKQADEKESICTGYVYIAPPDYHLLVEQSKTFSLTSDKHVKYSRPSIDLLFETAADVYNEKLIGIILTGANNDGSEGLLHVKNRGGLTIVQDPATAEFPYMPDASIRLGAAHWITSLEEIATYLYSINERK